MEYGILQSRGGPPGGVTIAMTKGTILTGQDLTMARESLVPGTVSRGQNGQWAKRPLCQLTCSRRLLPLSQSSWNGQLSWGVFSCRGGRQAYLKKLYVRDIKGYINQKASRFLVILCPSLRDSLICPISTLGQRHHSDPVLVTSSQDPWSVL